MPDTNLRLILERCRNGYLLIILVFLFAFNSVAQVNGNLKSIPLDPEILYGELSNGFKYFIKSIPDYESGIKMDLIHKIGSNDEKKGQWDFAHAIEHLAFKASKNFPFGVENSPRFRNSGNDKYEVDASSGRRQTTYEFKVPNGTLEGVKVGFTWYEDIVANLELAPEDIESVRGEVREEFLGKTGTELNESIAISKMYSRIFPCEISEEGLLGHYEYFSPEKVKQFYQTWYQPRFLTLNIVGKIENPDDLERQIRFAFSRIQSKDITIKPKNCDSLHFNRPPQFVVVESKKNPRKYIENEEAEIHWFFRIPSAQLSFHNSESIEQLLKYDLLLDILNSRFVEATQTYGSNMIYVYDLYDQGRPALMEIVHSFENGEGKKSIEKVGKVLHQLQRYGVLDLEFMSAKEKLLLEIGQSRREDQADYWLQQLSNYAVRGEVLPGDKKDLILKSLKKLKMEDMDNFIREILSQGPRDIGIVALEGHEALAFTEQEVRLWISDVFNQPVEPYQIPDNKNLMSHKEVEDLKPAKFLDIGTEESGAREFILNNRVKLVLFSHPLNDPVDQYPIHLHGFRPGGVKLLPEGDFHSAINAPGIVSHSGVKGLDKFQVNRILRQNGLLSGAVAPYLDYSEHGIYGTANLKNLEVMLQLIYLYFTSPNRNLIAFEDWKKERVNQYLDFKGDLYSRDYYNTFRTVTGDKYLRNSFNRKELSGGTEGYYSINKTDFKEAYDIYTRFFGDSENFTFLITGNFEVEQILPLAQKYLGNLPTRKAVLKKDEEKKVVDLGIPSFQEIENIGNYQMHNISYGTSYIIDVENVFDWQEHLKIEVLGEIVRQKLWDLRFKKGYGLYGLSARGKINYNLGRYEINTYLFCQSQDLPLLQKEIREIYTDIKAGKVPEKEMGEALERVKSFNFSQWARRVGALITELYYHYRYHDPWLDTESAKEYVDKISLQDIVPLAQKYLKKDNFHEFVIRDK